MDSFHIFSTLRDGLGCLLSVSVLVVFLDFGMITAGQESVHQMGIFPTWHHLRAKGHNPFLGFAACCLENNGNHIFPNGGLMISLLAIYHAKIHGQIAFQQIFIPKAPHRTGRLGRGGIARGVAGGFGDPGGF